MESTKKVSLFYKFFSLLSVVRGYNISVLVIAQYLASIYIFSPEKSLRNVVFDLHLFFIVFATVCVVAGGYIINSFYDSEKDLINRPHKTMLDKLVSQRTKLTGYFIINFVSVIFASYVSFKAVVFFSLFESMITFWTVF